MTATLSLIDMHQAVSVSTAVLWTVTAGLVLIALIPLLRTGRWFVRGWEFPRLQWAVLSMGVAGGWLIVGVSTSAASPWIGLLVAVAIAGCQLAYAHRYGPWWPKQIQPVGDRQAPSLLRVLATNLDMRNTSFDQASKVLREADPDVLLLIEINAAWSDNLSEPRMHYPHRIEHLAEDGVGLALWSKLPLVAPETKFLVNDDRASIWAALQMPDGRKVCFVGVHPVPPGLRIGRWYERFDSRMRDAELLTLGKHIGRRLREDPEQPWIVAGDFNDVAWSRTTREFERVSGLLDPRVGRKLLNTYHARKAWLRYPLDHVYASPHFLAGTLQRVRLPGSDHFAMLADLALITERPADAIEPAAEPEPAFQDRIRAGKAEAHDTDRTTGSIPSSHFSPCHA